MNAIKQIKPLSIPAQKEMFVTKRRLAGVESGTLVWGVRCTFFDDKQDVHSAVDIDGMGTFNLENFSYWKIEKSDGAEKQEIKPINKNHLVLKIKNMEKQIKMSLETAQEVWDKVKDRGDQKASTGSLNWLLQKLITDSFTKEELEPKKGYTWEESYVDGGWQIHKEMVEECRKVQLSNMIYARERFKTREQAESALAFAQLSHIVAKYNNGKIQDENDYCIQPFKGELMVTTNTPAGTFGRHLIFLNKQDAELSLEFNNQLWKQYWMLK